MNRICIVGVGLLGGSLGADIRKRKLAKEVVGVVRREESIEESLKLGVVDKATLDLVEGVKDSDMVILATPISIMPQKAKELAGSINNETIVIDIASVKGKLVDELEKILGNNYVGTHPMAGSEKRGVSGFKLGLFEGAKCIITPTKNTRPKFLKIVKEFWDNLGAVTLVLSPKEHDKLVAFISHLPHIVASSLVNNITDIPEALTCVGTGFKDSTRIAGSPPSLWKEICEWNKDEILFSIKKFEKELSEMKSLLKKGSWDNFSSKLQNAKDVRDKLNS